MRSARILLPGLALSAFFASGALATEDVKPSGAEQAEQAIAAGGEAAASPPADAQASGQEAASTDAQPSSEQTAAESNQQPAEAEQVASPAEEAVTEQAETSDTAPEHAAAEADQPSSPAEPETATAQDATDEQPAASESTAEAKPEEPAAEPAATAEGPSENSEPTATAETPEAASPAETDAAKEAAAVPADAQPQAEGEPASEAPVVVEYKFQPELLKQIAEAKGLSNQDREALTAFYEARGDDLLWVEDGKFTSRAEAAMAEIRQADDWGLEASAFDLPSAPVSADPADVASTELKLSLAVLKYANHARGGRVDPRRLSNYLDRQPPLLPSSEVLAGIAAADAADAYLRGLHPRHPQFEKLRQAYLALKNGTMPDEAEEEGAAKGKSAAKKERTSKEARLRKLLVNMEQWRWMPENLGEFYIWANIPEFTLRVMRDGESVFTERIIVGKADTQTPIFSDEMETIVFHPTWGVPDSIKVKEILPGLVRGTRVLERNDLRIQYRGKDIDPSRVDWTRVDIRNYHVYQPPGARNVLGVVKFLFPNKHAVYMHDTPAKHLFQSSRRMFSHGCMRVRNPLQFASVLLAESDGWTAGKVQAAVKSGQRNNHVNLSKKIPVHITYFTAWVDDDGKLKTWSDVYGHEQRIQMGLEGKAHLIAKQNEDLGKVQAEVVGRLAETRKTWSPSSSWSSNSQPDWARRVFGQW